MAKDKRVQILAIETSADETSAAVLRGDSQTRKFALESNIIHSQILVHQKTGGIVPEVAARAHIPKIIPVINLALLRAKLKLSQIDCLAVTAGPGLVTSLMIGVDTAKTLAFAFGKPIIPINHLEGHLFSALATACKLPPASYFPALGLIVSGGHTLLVLVKNFGHYQILGETLDDAAGEAFDKIAKILGLPYPGGPEIAKLAKKGNPKAYNLPRPMLNKNNFNFSFAGLKTAVLYLYQNYRVVASGRRPRGNLAVSGLLRFARNDQGVKANIAASVQAAIVDVLAAKTLRAAQEYRVKTVLLGGGVAANLNLRKTLKKQINKEIPNTKYLIPDTSLTGDNAGMIAQAAWFHYLSGQVTNFAKVKVDPNLSLKSWR